VSQSVVGSVVGIGQGIKDTGNALGDIWYAAFSSGKATLDWVSGKISTSDYSNILEANAATRRSIGIGFVSGAVENTINISSPVGGLGIIGQLWYIETGDTSISDVTSNLFQRKDDYLIDTFNLNEEQFNNGKAGANTYVMVAGLAISLGSSINARSSGYVSVADTPIADPYRMSYSGNAQVQMQGFTSTSEAIAFAQNRPASLMRKVAGEGSSQATKLYHSAGDNVADIIVENGFRTDLPNPQAAFNNNRFGRGVYLADSPATALAERPGGIILEVDANLGKSLDVTNRGILDYDMGHAIERGARKHGYDSIIFNSAQRSGGINTVILDPNNIKKVTK
jgi:hypothetical protein